MGAALAGMGILLANGAVAPAVASAAAPSPVIAEPSYAADLLDSVAPDATAHVVNIKGQVSRVSSGQIDAFNTLSASLQTKLGAAGEKQQVAVTAPRDTIMCPW